jgi:hypothetical protein
LPQWKRSLLEKDFYTEDLRDAVGKESKVLDSSGYLDPAVTI